MKSTMKSLRQKAYLEYQGDGLLDILIGLAIMGFGLSMIASAFMVTSWLPLMLYMPLKGLITIPRFGYVEFDSETRNRQKLTLTLLVGLMALSVFTGLFFWFVFANPPAGLDAFLGKYILLVLGGFMALMMLAAAFMLGLRRYYVYAGLTMLVLWAGIELGLDEHLFVIGLGLVFVIPGTYMLWRFIQKYPVAEQDG